MTKYLLNASFLLLFSLFEFNVSAQNFNINWAPQNKSVSTDFLDAVPTSNGNLIILRLDIVQKRFTEDRDLKYAPTVILYDKEMNVLKEMIVPIFEKNAIVKGFQKYGSNMYFIYTAYEKKTATFYAIKIDENTLEPISKTTLATFVSEKDGDHSDAILKQSSDSTKVLLMAIGSWKRKETEKLYFAVFDSDLKQLWNKQVDLGIPRNELLRSDLAVTNSGKVYIAMQYFEYENSRKKWKNEDNQKMIYYDYKIYAFNNETDKSSEVKLGSQGLHVVDSRLIENKDGSVSVCCLYRQTFDSRVKGMYFGLLDFKSFEIKDPKFIEFPKSLLEKVEEDGYASANGENPGLSSNFGLRNIMYRSNGSIDVLCEYQNYKEKDRATMSKSRKTDVAGYLTFGDIINTNINPQGQTIFTRVPRMRKAALRVEHVEFYPTYINGDLLLLYTDSKSNVYNTAENKLDITVTSAFNNVVLVAGVIDSKGNLNRQIIYVEEEELDFRALPKFTRKISENNFYVLAKKWSYPKLWKGIGTTRFGILGLK